ncbi:MAG TPA: DUF4390 domain-containing protein [Thermoanaerobaculia bacterium]|nr:DUF4390 domain-containing protein [Thermoanaerobaculia bacterium]
MRPPRRLLPLLALLLLAAAADRPAVTDVVAALDGREVRVSFRLAEAFDERVRERLAAGLPTGFTYEIELLRDRKRWWDAGLVEASLEVAAMYNALSRDYLLNFKRDGRLVESRTVRELADLERAMTEVGGLAAFSVPDGVRGRKRLLVRVRAKLGAGTVLGFIPTERETAWAESRKFRLPAEER